MITRMVADACMRSGLDRSKPLVVGCSGGMDSVLLATVLHEATIPIHLAHVNYGLRGDESQRDEAFVRELAQQWGVPFFLLNAQEEMSGEGNTQALARSIRYRWFRELMLTHGASAICVAHHYDDQIETLIHQFVRGGGPRTFVGMQELKDGVFRPFLSITKEMIQSSAHELNLRWVEDSSNVTHDYTRNHIRHQLKASLLAINPGLDEALSHRAVVTQAWLDYAEKSLERELVQNIESVDGDEWLSASWLNAHEAPRLVLHAWLHQHGFDSNEAYKLLHANPGARIESEGLILWKERERILLSGSQEAKAFEFQVHEKSGSLKHAKAHLEWSFVRVDAAAELNASVIALDIEQHPLPWTIRTWRAGDRFQPLGMQGTQTIGDFLTHQSLPMRERSDVLVLEANGVVAWVIGLRVSERFRFNNFGKTAIRFQYSADM
ncbi:MAG: tRNA lysidine(34) synthetase TilS [Flavobacteriales bacterium]